MGAWLGGAWVAHPPSDVALEDLRLAEPYLLDSGAGPLAWHRVRASPFRGSRAGEGLRQAYRLSHLSSELRRRELVAAVGALRAEGIDPLLIKGWAIARSYPEEPLRPHGDNDLCVRAGQFEAARAVLARGSLPADLHQGVPHAADDEANSIFERSREVDMDGAPIRIQCPEDRLRTLIFHFLDHGGSRPIWLCDIALAIEDGGSAFDWGLCLRGKPRERQWICAVVALASEVLGATIADDSNPRRARSPRWLSSSVLDEWCLRQADRSIALQKSLGAHLGSVASFRRGLRYRWMSPLQATLALKAPIGCLPRLPLQLAAVLLRGVRFFGRR